jgi:hypothetical protein
MSQTYKQGHHVDLKHPFFHSKSTLVSGHEVSLAHSLPIWDYERSKVEVKVLEVLGVMRYANGKGSRSLVAIW